MQTKIIIDPNPEDAVTLYAWILDSGNARGLINDETLIIFDAWEYTHQQVTRMLNLDTGIKLYFTREKVYVNRKISTGKYTKFFDNFARIQEKPINFVVDNSGTAPY